MSATLIQDFFPISSSYFISHHAALWQHIFPPATQSACPSYSHTLRAETSDPWPIRWPALLPIILIGVLLGAVQFSLLSSAPISRYLNPGYAVSFLAYGVMCGAAAFCHCLLPSITATEAAAAAAGRPPPDRMYHDLLVSADVGATLAACISASYGAIMPLPPPGQGYPPLLTEQHYRTIVRFSATAFWLAFFPMPYLNEALYMGSIGVACVIVAGRLWVSWQGFNADQRFWARWMIAFGVLAAVAPGLDQYLCLAFGSYVNLLSVLFLACNGIYWCLAGFLTAGVPPSVLTAALAPKAD